MVKPFLVGTPLLLNNKSLHPIVDVILYFTKEVLLMKPFLGIDLTTDKKNEQVNGTEFLAQKPSAALTNTLEASSEKAEATLEKSKLPKALRIVQYICCFTGLLVGSSILRADVSLAEGYQNAPWAYWIAGICLPIWFVLWIWSKRRAKAVLEIDESTQTFSHLEGTASAIYQELSVPGDAKTIDVLSFFYKIKDGELKLQEKGLQIAQYFNPEFKIFTDKENLYLANLEGKYAFPLSSIVKIHTVKKHIRIAGWNKDEKYNKGIYKQFKLTTDNFGCIHCNQYHVLEITYQGDSYGIYIPCYVLPTLE